MFEQVLIIEIIWWLTCTLGFTYLCHHFFEPKYKGIRIKTSFISCSDMISFLAFSIFFYLKSWIWAPIKIEPLSLKNIIIICIQTIFLFAITFLLYKKQRNLKIFIIFKFSAITQITYLLSLSAMNLFRGLYQEKIYEEALKLPTQIERNKLLMPWVLSETFIFCLIVVSSCAFMFRILIKKFPDDKRLLDKKEMLFLTAPSLACIIIGVVFQSIVYPYENSSMTLILQRDIIGALFVPLGCLILLAVLIITLDLFNYVSLFHKEKSQRIIIKNQIEDMLLNVRSAEQVYDGIRTLKHDMRNHLAHLKGLIEMENIQSFSIVDYLGSLEGVLDSLDFKYLTGNPVTDVIINQQLLKIQGAGISFESSFQYANHLGIDVFDIGIILSNALDNAFRACLSCIEENKDAFIDIHSYNRKSLYFIEIKNSFTGDISFDSRTGLPLTTKEDKIHHGLGLGSIKTCAEKYSGGVDITTNDDVFFLTVMLKGN